VSDLVSRLLEAISETERLAREASETGAGPAWRFEPCDGGQCGGHLRLEGSRREIIACQSCEGGGLYYEVGPHVARNDPSSVLRRCEQDRWLVEWYVGWQGTFRGPIPEGHTEEGALHFRMASEFVFNRLLASYGIDWADDGDITEEET
jgi:hypothetical protein